jgi:hypothetical protein
MSHGGPLLSTSLCFNAPPQLNFILYSFLLTAYHVYDRTSVWAMPVELVEGWNAIAIECNYLTLCAKMKLDGQSLK